MTDIFLALVALFGSSPKEIPTEIWRCSNQVEVWCAADGCAATAEGEMTPMDITASADGRLSVCAYTGCWEGEAAYAATNGRLVWAGDALTFSTAPEGGESDATLLIIARDGVGFVRAGGLASPVLCARSRPFEE